MWTWAQRDSTAESGYFSSDKKTERWSIPHLSGVVPGDFDGDGIVALSKLPGKDELRAKLLSLFKAAPTQFVRTVVEAPTGFARVLRAREQQLAE